jgi:hypothetical protein
LGGDSGLVWGWQMYLYFFGYLRGSYLSAMGLGTVSWLMSAYGHEGETSS